MPDRTTVPRARSAVPPLLQRSENAAVTTWSNAAKATGGGGGGGGAHGGLSGDHKFQISSGPPYWPFEAELRLDAEGE